MKVEEFNDGPMERQILVAMIANGSTLARISSKWDDKMFSSSWANWIGRLCVDYYRNHQKAPRRHIISMFQADAEHRDESTIKLGERFLGSLSNEFSLNGDINPDYVTDLAGKHFNRVRLKRALDLANGHIDNGRLDKAEEAVTKYHRLEMGEGSYVSPLIDEEVIRDCFSKDDEKPLIEYDGALGQFFDNELRRDSLISFLAPEKTGKTWWLMEVAFRAVRQRRRVAFFEVGDMSQKQLLKRLFTRVAKHPKKAVVAKYPIKISSPPNLAQHFAEVTHEMREFQEPLDELKVREACRRFMSETVRSKKDFFRLSTHANSTINVMGIHSLLQTWELNGWVPDVVVIDYADILAPPAGTHDERDRINTSWKQMRALSQQFRCLVLTATQADAASYNQVKPLDRSNFSDDKRKQGHVSGIVGLNVSPPEKERGLFRLNWVVSRDLDASSTRCVHVASCLALGKPFVLSTW